MLLCISFFAPSIGAGTVSQSFLEEGVALAQSPTPLKTLESSVKRKLDDFVEAEIQDLTDRMEVSVQGVSTGQPSFSILSVQPYFESDDLTDTFLGQFSVVGHDGRTTVNLGTAYRYLTPSKHWLLGMNGFYDYEYPYGHQRMSLGLESKSSIIEFNANHYYALSGWKSGKDAVQEIALDGNDLEVGLTLPYLPSSKLYYKKFKWDTVNGLAEIRGKTISLEVSGAVLPGITVEIGATNFDVRKDSEYMKITYTYSSKPRVDRPLVSSAPYKMESMESKRLQKVRRENRIVKQTGGGLTIAFR